MTRVGASTAPAPWRRPLPPVAVAVLVVLAAGLALLPPPLNVAAAVGLATAALVLLRPIWGLYLVILSVPVQDVAAVQVSGAAITATKVLVPVALLSWLALVLVRDRPAATGPLPRSMLTLPYIGYVAVLAASVVLAANQLVALTETVRWVQAAGVFLMTLDLVRSRRDLIGLVAMLLIGGAFQAAVGLTQSVIGAGPASFAVAAGFSRAFGTFGMPNSYAGYLEMTFPLALALSVWLTGRNAARRSDSPALAQRIAWVAVVATTVLTLLGILASYSRGAWLGTTVGVATMIALAGRRSLAAGAMAAVVGAALLVVGGAALLPAELTDRLATVGDALGYRDVRRMVITSENWAVAERLAMWEAGLSMARSAPVLGVGAGNFDVVYRQHNVPQFIFSRGHAHNYYIHAAAETGMIGLAAYVVLLVAAWLDIGRGLRRLEAGLFRALTLGAAGVLAAVMVHHLVENLHVLNMNLHLFTVLALPVLALRVQAREAWSTAEPAP